MSSKNNGALEKLLVFRDSHIERCIRVGSIALDLYEQYVDLAKEASLTNQLARLLPAFTISLFDEEGASGIIEYSVSKELPTID